MNELYEVIANGNALYFTDFKEACDVYEASECPKILLANTDYQKWEIVFYNYTSDYKRAYYGYS